MKPALATGGPCRYYTDRPNCWQKGTVLSFDRYTVTVKPGRTDLDPIELPRRQVQPLTFRARQKAAVAGVLAVLQVRIEAPRPAVTPSPIIVHLGGQPRPVPPPPRRIVSRPYLKWIRSQPCCVPTCGAKAQAHHYSICQRRRVA